MHTRGVEDNPFEPDIDWDEQTTKELEEAIEYEIKKRREGRAAIPAQEILTDYLANATNEELIEWAKEWQMDWAYEYEQVKALKEKVKELDAELVALKREDADLPEWDTPGTPVHPDYVSEFDALRAENERLLAFIRKVALFCNDPHLSHEAGTITPGAELV